MRQDFSHSVYMIQPLVDYGVDLKYFHSLQAVEYYVEHSLVSHIREGKYRILHFKYQGDISLEHI